MPPTARSSPPLTEEVMLDDLELDDIPSLDDIIPWTEPERKPRQLEVTDPVRTAEGINVMFLQNVLRSFYSRGGATIPDVRVESHTETALEAPNVSENNVLTAVTVRATVDGRGETYHLVIKTLTSPRTVKSVSAVHSSDNKREVGFYTEILDNFNVFQQQEINNPERHIVVPVPNYLFARHTPPREETASGDDRNVPCDETVIVLENVRHQGFTHTLVKAGLSREKILSVLEGIARVHSLSLAMKERSGIPLHKSYPYLLCMSEAARRLAELYDQKEARIMRLLTAFGAQTLVEKLKNLREHLEELLEALAQPDEPMSVLGHMNLSAHNILFKGNKCLFVDWQMVTSSRPTFDMAFLLATSVKASIRRRYTYQFLNHYYERFIKFGLKFGLGVQGDLEYSKGRLWRDYCYSQLLALYFYIAKSDDLLKSREAQLQFMDFIFDLDEQNLLRPDLINPDSPEYVTWKPRDPSKPDILFRISRRRSSDDDSDPTCGVFPEHDLSDK